MRIFILLALCWGLLTACIAPPLNPQQLQGLESGQTRDHILAQLRQSPRKVIHTSFDSDDYVVYFYQLQTATRMTTICKTAKVCTQSKEPVLEPYLFIFKGANPPRLAYFNTLDKLKKSPLAKERTIMEQIEMITPIPGVK